MSLKDFYEDKELQNQWAEFIMETLNIEALRRVYSQESTLALKEARDIINKSFTRLNALYSPKPKPRQKPSAE